MQIAVAAEDAGLLVESEAQTAWQFCGAEFASM